MNVTTREQNNVAVVTIVGDIDSQTAPQAQGTLLPFVEEHHKIVMELGGVHFMSSAGLRMMLLIYRHANAKGGKVALVGLSEQIRDTMSATGFLGFFEVCNSTDEALKAVNG